MKLDPQKKLKKIRAKEVVCGLVLLSLIFSLATPAAASLPSVDEQLKIPFLAGVQVETPLSDYQRGILAAQAKAAEKLKQALQHAAYIAAKRSVNYLLNTLAYDTATWLASGAKGQGPMFYDQSWGDYLTDVVDGAAGTFIQELGENWLGFNVCEPNINFRLSIGLGLYQTTRPKKPDCTLKEAINNWEEFVNNPNFLNDFMYAFTPEGNDILIGLDMYGKYFDFIQQQKEAQTKAREEGKGYKAVEDRLSYKILSPVGLTDAAAWDLIQKGKIDSADVDFGDIITYSFGTFIDTLAYKLFQRLLREGLLALRGGEKDSDSGRNIYSPTEDTSNRGKQAAEARFIDFLSADISIPGPYDVLTKMASCPFPDNPGPEECVIDGKFRIAIDRELTVREAINQGLLDGNAPFGFTAQGFQPPYLEGYPNRSLMILRAHRIIPVTWEIAANIINRAADFNIDQRTYGLNDLINKYNDELSPFYRLIDENWLLKVPEHFCKAEGYGPNVISEQIIGGTSPRRSVTRADYCADYQSCIQKDIEGNCIYGYCTQEKKVWNLQGEDCPAYYNTCQTLRGRDGETVSYLQNSLDYNGCSIDNVGCQWYCQDYNTTNNIWTCVNKAEEVLKPCVSPGGCLLTAGCNVPSGEVFCSDALRGVNLTISSPCTAGSKWWVNNSCSLSVDCRVPQGGVSCVKTGCETLANLLPNAGFETGSAVAGQAADRWSSTNGLTYFERVSGATERIYSGRNSIRFYNTGGQAGSSLQSNSLTLPAGSYTLAGFVYNHLNNGEITLMVNGTDDDVVPTKSSSIKNNWEELSFDFSSSGAPVTVVITVSGTQVSGSAWFDNFKVSTSCITQPVTLTLVGTLSKDQSKLHFDRDANQCNADSDGCSELYSSPTKWIVNLLYHNASFEAYRGSSIYSDQQEFNDWTANDSNIQAVTDKHSGATALRIKGSGSNAKISTQIDTGGKVASRSFVISYYAKAEGSPSSLPVNEIKVAGGSFNQPINNSGLNNSWKRFFAFFTVPANQVGNTFEITLKPASGSVVLYDDIQLEEVNPTFQTIPSDFQGYTTLTKTNLRQAPDYLSCQGYTFERPSPYVLDGVLQSACTGQNLKWRPDDCNGAFCCHEVDSPECSNYAMYCEQDEVGCESYTPVAGGPMIPAVVAYDDYCPAECIGYEAYKQSPTYFENLESLEYFIPATARQCSAAEVGCDEFTNLDEVAKGGEGREYYKYLRLCEKSSEGANCSNFYTWQGSDEAGYQLKVYQLVANIDGSPQNAVASAAPWANWPSSWCSDKSDTNSNGLPDCCDGSEDILNNPFCKEFYGVSGNIYYRIYDNTVSCSEDCHPFRRTIVTATESECVDSGGRWENSSCTHYAIPTQGSICSAASAGCREYRGNTAGNVYAVLSDDFEDGETSGWRNGQISSEALTVGGHSLKTSAVPRAGIISHLAETAWLDLGEECRTSSASYDINQNGCVAHYPSSSETCIVEIGERYCGEINNKLNPDKSYIISFWAKSADANVVEGVKVELLPDSPAEIPIPTTNISPDWNYYSFGPFVYNKLQSQSRLLFTATRDIYLDNIEIKEIRDYVYALKNSWKTPVSCDTNPFVDPPQSAPQFMLGCAAYRDTANRIHNLKSFNHLCREEAAGCEALIDTRNSTSPYAEEFNIGDDIGYVNVPADKIIYMVNRPEFQCSADVKGCQRLGSPVINRDGEVTGYNNVYLLNNPDQYASALCSHPEVGCEEYQSVKGYSYFKDPSNKTCEYAEVANRSGLYWVKSGSDSASPEYCPVTRSPLGVIHPSDGWAGLCPASLSGCSEFIDPISDIAKNIVFNPDFKQDVDGNDVPDGWNLNVTEGRDANYLRQFLNLKRDTLYTLSFKEKIGANLSDLTLEVIDCPGVSSLDFSMVLVNDAWQLPPENYRNDSRNYIGTETKYSARFFVPHDLPNNSQCQLRISKAEGSNIQQIKEAIKEVAVRETGVYYALADSVDRFSCNGLVDSIQGCVLFNDRGGVNYKLGETDNSYLKFDADVSGSGINSSIPVSECAGVCDSSQILKVRPDRSCGEWLDCRTKIKTYDEKGAEKDLCIELGACDSLDEKGECDNFVVPSRQKLNAENDNLTVYRSNNEALADVSGYAKAGMTVGNFANSNTTGGYYPYNLMDQIGEVAKVPNGYFEDVTAEFYPIGWHLADPTRSRETYRFRVVTTNPDEEKAEGIKVIGAGSLKLTSDNVLASELFDVFPSTNYVLTASVNTLNLQPVNATAVVEVIADEIDEQAARVLATLSFDARLNWQNKSIKFPTGSNDTLVKIRLKNVYTPSTKLGGATYFDEIALMPALNIRDIPRTTAPAGWDPESIGRSCRIYPQSDALSCEYTDENNVFRHGWSGYCLEKDPQHPDVCLQWWPVDLIKGDQFGFYQGYKDRSPLYMCLEISPIYVEKKNLHICHTECNQGVDEAGCNVKCQVNVEGEWKNCGEVPGGTGGKKPCPPGYKSTEVKGDPCYNPWPFKSGDENDYYCEPKGSPAFPPDEEGRTWYPYNGQYLEAKVTTQYGDNDFGGTFIGKTRGPECLAFVQVVTPNGYNKAWVDRVAEGSIYGVPNLLYGYGADWQPFGGAVPPAPADNPPTWDSNTQEVNNQPLYILPPDTTFAKPYQVRAGSPWSCDPAAPYSSCEYIGVCLPSSGQLCIKGMWGCPSGQTCSYITTENEDGDEVQDLSRWLAVPSRVEAKERLKRLFAQSYGFWQWDYVDRRYTPTSDENWEPPTTLCTPNNTRPEGFGTGDWCAVAPVINRLEINNTSTSNLILISSAGAAKVTLEFNATLDPNQLPLTSYRVDWGDGTETSVSGTNLRDKSNISDPFIFTHSYGYYDLLGKNQANDKIRCTGEAPPAGWSVLPAPSSNQCVIKPKVQIYDNWGWCNGNYNPVTQTIRPDTDWGYSVKQTDPHINCSSANENAWTYFPGYIIVGLTP